MLKGGYINEIRAFIAPKIIGGAEALTPVTGDGIEKMSDSFGFKLESVDTINGDIYAKYINE